MTVAKITKADILAGLKQIEGDELNPAQLEALLASIAAMAAAKDPATGEEPEAVEPPEASEPSGESEMPPEAIDLGCAPKETTATALGAFPSNVTPTPSQVIVVDPNAEQPPPMPEAPAAQADVDGQAMAGAKLAEATGLGGAALLAAIEQNLDAIVSAIRGAGGQIADLTAASAGGAIAALSARLAVFETREAALLATAKANAAAAAQAATEGEIAALVSSGSILPAMVDTFRSLAREAPAQYRALTASLPKGSAFPAGVSAALAKPDTTPVDLSLAIDESRPEVRALRAMFRGKPKADADAAVLRSFGPTKQVG